MDKALRIRQFFPLCKQLFNISLFGLYVVITLETSSSAAKPVAKKSQSQKNHPIQSRTDSNTAKPTAKLNNWRFSPEALKLEITLSAGTTPRYFYLSQPSRIVVDLPQTKLGYVPTKQNYSGAIQGIRISQLNAGVTRIVMDLAAGTFVDPKQIQLQPVSKKNRTRWVLRPVISSYSPPSIQPGLQPSPNIPPNLYNYYPQPPSNLSPSNYPQLPSTLPPTNTNQQPFVTVPPLTPTNSSQLPNLPPPAFPNQPSNFNGTLPVTSPDFPTPTVPVTPNNYPPPNEPNIEVIEFGQPLPKRSY